MAVVVALGVSRSSTSPGSEVGTLSKVLILALRNSVSMLKSLREEEKTHLVVFHGVHGIPARSRWRATKKITKSIFNARVGKRR